MKKLSWRLAIVGVVVLAAIVYTLPTFQPTLWPHKKINLGLDLQGGMHLVLEVQTHKAVESTLERIRDEIRHEMRKERIRFKNLDFVATPSPGLSIEIRGKENIDKFNTLLDDKFRDMRVNKNAGSDDDALGMLLDLTDEEVKRIKELAVSQALETIRNRIDQFGVAEPDIRRQGENRILIQLPGVSDTKRAWDLIGKTALLEFKLLDETQDPATAEKQGASPGTEVLYKVTVDPDKNRVLKTPFVVRKRAALTGEYLVDARVKIDQRYNEPYVGIRFDKKGARIFERVTGENVKKRLAIILDGKVYSAPVIQDRIAGGEAQITGSFSMEEARDLAIVLRAGALPAPVEKLEERVVGPSLGHDSINKGLMSMCIGGVLVVIFMIIYYKGSGLIADFALALNILIIAGGLAGFQATLTLPGIAGIILTIGMAVDANVLIFERIREEMNLGKTPRASVDAGYSRATLTILDANVTTLIAALVLFQFGTGAVKGFAITLSLGVIASLFTALFMSRLVFDYLLMSRKIKNLSI
ncbi:MAG: protein translocase subunit SecD [Desulfobacterales bacterium]|nr:protein translocase subunit SecD [Desulfobacterales bacterium]